VLNSRLSLAQRTTEASERILEEIVAKIEIPL
jgi:hypothetical protein